MTRRANGEGSVTLRGDGRWMARMTLPNGKRKAFYGKTRQEVSRRLAAALTASHDGMPIVSENEKLGHYLRRWLESARPGLRPRTWTRYEQLVRLHVPSRFARMTLHQLAPQHLEAIYADRIRAGLAPRTVRQLHAVLRRALGQAQRWGMVQRNVATLANPPRAAKYEVRTLTPDQARRLLDVASDDRLEALYVLALTTGMRQGEILALRWADLDLERRTLMVQGSMQRTADGLAIVEPKTSKSRRQLQITRRAAGALRRHRLGQTESRLRLGASWAENDLVFPNAVGRPMDASHFYRHSFQPLVKRVGLPPMRFHDLRHTAATFLLKQGVHPKVASEMLGHSQIAITLDLYSHVMPSMQREAADSIDALLADGG